jgi:hypothetical protein
LAACGDDDKSNGQSDAAPCKPTTCDAESKNCGSMPDGCGGVLKCGSCNAPEVCGGGGVANVCGAGSCTPTTCSAEGKNCGTISDGCGDVLSCGSCTAPETCGGGGVANVCGGSKPSKDAGPSKADAAAGACDPTCMAQAGAVCCTSCGCKGTVKCTPVCDSPTKWDCEMRCCFDYSALKCQ